MSGEPVMSSFAGAPELSFVVPSFNCEAWLERAVASTDAWAATHAIEVIVVNDGSTDGTQALIERLQRTRPHLKAIHQANAGLSVARNVGIRAANGTYTVLLDGDDELAPADLRPVLAGQPDVLRVGVEEILDGVCVARHAEPESLSGSGRTYLRLHFERGTFYTPSWAYIYRTAWLRQQQLRFVPGLLHEDNLFTVQALLAAQTVRVLPTPVYRYIRREGSITTAPGDARRLKRIDAYCQIAAELTRMANQDRSFDLRWKIQEVLDGAHTLARQCQGRSGHARVLRAHLRYMLAYRGVGAPGFRYLQRHRARTYARAWWQGQQAAQR